MELDEVYQTWQDVCSEAGLAILAREWVRRGLGLRFMPRKFILPNLSEGDDEPVVLIAQGDTVDTLMQAMQDASGSAMLSVFCSIGWLRRNHPAQYAQVVAMMLTDYWPLGTPPSGWKRQRPSNRIMR